MHLKQIYSNGTKWMRLALGVRSRIPREVQLEITNRCNLDCDMCPRLTLLRVPEIDMSRTTFDAVLSRLRAPSSITLTGWGEPLMHPELFGFIDTIATRFPSADVGFTTNGHLLTDGIMKQIFARRIGRINVSLEELPWDGDEPELPVDHRTGNALKGAINHVARDGHPTPPKVVAKLRSFLKQRREREERGEHVPEVRLQVVLFPGSEETTLRLIDFAADLGFQAVNLVRLDVRGRPDLSRPGYSEERRLISLSRARAEVRGVPLGSVNDHGVILRSASHSDRFCIRLDSYIYVDVEGNVAPCCLLRDHRLGNLVESSLESIWDSPEFKRFYGPGVHPACEGCDAFMHNYKEPPRSRTLPTARPIASAL
jgi:MoaA/NifB/PqqE/SkfB family radical SAM enzyme